MDLMAVSLLILGSTNSIFCRITQHHFMRTTLEVSMDAMYPDDKDSTVTASIMKCADFCIAMETCVAFSYRKRDQHCLRRNDSNLLSFPDQTLTTRHYKKVVEGACDELWEAGYRRSGVYPMTLSTVSFSTFCDFSTAGEPWTVFQRRLDGSEDFYRNWTDYQVGFGSPDGEFWLGNDLLHWLTASGLTRLRVDLEDFENETVFAEFSSFQVADASLLYRLNVSGYSGTAGNAMRSQNGQNFSTFDRDHDKYSGNCAERFDGAWWYAACHCSNLNGAYLGGNHTTYANGVNWCSWRGTYYSLKTTVMKVKRPSSQQLPEVQVPKAQKDFG